MFYPVDGSPPITLAEFLAANPNPSELDNFLIQWIRLMEAYQVSGALCVCVCRVRRCCRGCVFLTQDEMASAARDAATFLQKYYTGAYLCTSRPCPAAGSWRECVELAFGVTSDRVLCRGCLCALPTVQCLVLHLKRRHGPRALLS